MAAVSQVCVGMRSHMLRRWLMLLLLGTAYMPCAILAKHG